VSNSSWKNKIPQQELLKQADLVLYCDSEEQMTGLVISLNNNDDWWGGGYYNILWSSQTWVIEEGQEVSYEEMHRWRLSNIAKIFPAPNK
jgi:hypothetical protein